MFIKNTESKPRPADGIFLTGNNWLLFEPLFLEYVARNYGRLREEISMEEDIEFEIEEPEGDPEGFQYKMAMERAKLLLREESDLKSMRYKLFGDMMLHLSLTSERKVISHADYEIAEIQQSPRLLWGIIRITHIAPQHAGEIGIWEYRRKLMALQQGTTSIEEHSRRFSQLYDQLLAMGDESIDQEMAAQAYVMSLNGEIFGEELTRWARNGEVPNNLPAATRMCIEWYRQIQNATKAMGHGAPMRGTRHEAKEEVGFITNRQHYAQGPKHAASIGTCPICHKKANHTLEQCYQLPMLCERAKATQAGRRQQYEGPAATAAEEHHYQPRPAQAQAFNPRGRAGAGARAGRGAGGRAGAGAGARSGAGADIRDQAKPAVKRAWTTITKILRYHGDTKRMVILDTGASASVWNHTDNLEETHRITPIRMEGVNASSNVTHEGTHRYFGRVLIVPECPANLLSMSGLQDHGFRLVYSEEEAGFKAFNLEQETFYFDKTPEGLYALRNNEPIVPKPQQHTYTTLTSELDDGHDEDYYQGHDREDPVDDAHESDDETSDYIPPKRVRTEERVTQTRKGAIPNPVIEQYTNNEVTRANEARKLCYSLGHVGKDALIRMLKYGCVTNSTVTIQDIYRAEKILGPCPGCIRGKTVKSKRGYVEPEIPDEPVIPEVTRPEVLHADLIFVPSANGSKQIGIVSVGQRTRLVLASKLPDKFSESIKRGWLHHIAAYKEGNIIVKEIHTDNEATLASTTDFLAEHSIVLHQHPSQQHEPFCERRIRTIKERTRAIMAELPYPLPWRLAWHAIIWAIQGMNVTPDTLSPEDGVTSAWEKVKGVKPNLSQISKYQFGELVVYHTDTNADCNLSIRTDYSIVVGRNLNTGNVTVWNPTTLQTVTRRTVTRVQGMPTYIHERITSISETDKGHNLDDDPTHHITRLTGADTLAKKYRETYDIPPEDSDEDDEDYVPDDVSEGDGDSDISYEDEDDINTTITAAPPQTTPTPTPMEPRTLRPNRGLGHSINVSKITASEYIYRMSIGQAILEYGDPAEEAIRDELNKMIDLNVFTAVHKRDTKGVTIPCSMFIKPKHHADGSFDKIKARMVAGGHRQDWSGEEECSSPTVSWETVLTFLATASRYRLYLYNTDIPAAYLQASRGSTLKPIYMKISQDIADKLIELKPEWTNFLDNGNLHVQVHKAMYGLKESGLDWYKDLTETLSNMGFIPSTTDKCVFIQHRSGKLRAILLIYVDDILIASRLTTAGDNIIKNLEERYGELKVNRDNFSFLGANIVRSVDEIKVDCSGYIIKTAYKYGITVPVDSPFPSNFDTKQGYRSTRDRDPADKEAYRSIVMSLMYVAKRVRLDILFITTLLATRVSSPLVGDYKTARRIMAYLLTDPTAGIQFNSDSDPVLKTYADASFNTHPDAKSHTGIVCTLLDAPVFFKSKKQTLISRSSTESEIIACESAVDIAMWIKRLCDEIGYSVDLPLTVFQDNQSAITLMCNGGFEKKRAPINVKFEWIKERVEGEDIKLVYLPSSDMRADILTKCLHGNNFIKLSGSLLSSK